MLKGLKESHNGVSFTVVAPSLPNFAWSEGVKVKGFGLKQYAEVGKYQPCRACSTPDG